jgi:hypothetical protein
MTKKCCELYENLDKVCTYFRNLSTPDVDKRIINNLFFLLTIRKIGLSF